MKLVIVAATALVDSGGKVLLAQRPQGKNLAGLWEFPGGKIEPDELPEEALIRELKEELDIKIEPADLTAISFVSHSYESFHLLMLLYGCRQWQGIPQANEHAALKWVNAESLGHFPMPPADIPLLPALRRFMGEPV